MESRRCADRPWAAGRHEVRGWMTIKRAEEYTEEERLRFKAQMKVQRANMKRIDLFALLIVGAVVFLKGTELQAACRSWALWRWLASGLGVIGVIWGARFTWGSCRCPACRAWLPGTPSIFSQQSCERCGIPFW